jgi:hypothetical protein
MNSLKITLASLLVLACASSYAADVTKNVKKEDKNIQTETQQLHKEKLAQHQLRKDTSMHKIGMVTGKDKVVKKYHSARLHHETKKGADLTKKIQTGQ